MEAQGDLDLPLTGRPNRQKDEIDADCFRPVFEPAMRDVSSVYSQIRASFYFGPGGPNKPVFSMFKCRPGFINGSEGKYPLWRVTD